MSAQSDYGDDTDTAGRPDYVVSTIIGGEVDNVPPKARYHRLIVHVTEAGIRTFETHGGSEATELGETIPYETEWQNVVMERFHRFRGSLR